MMLKSVKIANQAFLYRYASQVRPFSTAPLKTEVLIVGGGATGGSIACALSQSDYFDKH